MSSLSLPPSFTPPRTRRSSGTQEEEEVEALKAKSLTLFRNTLSPNPVSREALNFDLSAFGRKSLLKGPVRIVYINGINTTLLRCRLTAELLSDYSGGVNVFGVYNPTRGGCVDILDSLSLFYGRDSGPAKRLRRVWETFFQGIGDEGYLLQICSSQGALHVRNALKRFPEELRKRIVIIALAPACHINPALCHSITTYHTLLDPVPYIDLVGRIRYRENVHIVRSHHEMPSILDHSPTTPSFMLGCQESMYTFFDLANVFEGGRESVPVLEEGDRLGYACLQSPEAIKMMKITRGGRNAPAGPSIQSWQLFYFGLSDLRQIELYHKWSEYISKALKTVSKITLAVQLPELRIVLLGSGCIEALSLTRFVIITNTRPSVFREGCSKLRFFAMKVQSLINLSGNGLTIALMIGKYKDPTSLILISPLLLDNLYKFLWFSIPQMREGYEKICVRHFENEPCSQEEEENILNRDIEVCNRVNLLRDTVREILVNTATMSSYGLYYLLSHAAVATSGNSTIGNMTTDSPVTGNVTSGDDEVSGVLETVNFSLGVIISGVMVVSTALKCARVYKIFKRPFARR